MIGIVSTFSVKAQGHTGVDGRRSIVTVIFDKIVIRDTAISYPLLNQYDKLIKNRKPYSARKALQKFGEYTIYGLVVVKLVNGYRLDTLTMTVKKVED
jgi:hypothetical protein